MCNGDDASGRAVGNPDIEMSSRGNFRVARHPPAIKDNLVEARRTQLLWSEFLSAPPYHFGCEDRTIRTNSDLVRIEVWSLARGQFVDAAHYPALRIDLQYASGHRVGHVQEVVRHEHQAKRVSDVPLP